MLGNLWRTTWRHLANHPRYTLINVFGLALGMAAFMLIGAYVRFENSYDRLTAPGGEIYRVESDFYRHGQLSDSWASATNGYATAMKQHFPEVAATTRISWSDAERTVRHGTTVYREERVAFADSNFLSFFGYPLVSGNASVALREPNTIVLSASAAKKYFGSADPVGATLDVSTTAATLHCRVTGVFRDLPANSTLQVNFLLSWLSSPTWMRDFWYLHENYTYVKLAPGASPRAVEKKFPALAEQYKTNNAMKELTWAIRLVPVEDIHLSAAKPYEIETKGNRTAVWLLGAIAWVVLAIAYANYVNLATVKAMDRAREVGIRKVNGAATGQLLGQFLFESFVLNLAALAFAAALAAVAIRVLPRWLGGDFVTGWNFSATGLAQLVLVWLAGILLSGSYPALLLARLRPVQVLKGRAPVSARGGLLRTALVVFQFAASLLLICGTLAVYRQVSFMRSQHAGVNLDQTLVLKTPASPGNEDRWWTFKQALLSLPGVEGVTISGAVPGHPVSEPIANRRLGAPPSDERTYDMLKVDHDFIRNYGLVLVAGRAFDRSIPTDSTALVLNESAVRQFGFASNEAALGQRILLETRREYPAPIIGVVRDYHQQSLQTGFTPVILFMDPAFPWIPAKYISVRLRGNTLAQSIPAIRDRWVSYFPEASFDHFFLDEFFDRQYRQDAAFGKLFALFSVVAIAVACLGLFGLSAYAVSRRVKEIGVRKILGASVMRLVVLLAGGTLRMIALAALLALPLAGWLASRWLHHYAFRAPLGAAQFLLPLGLLLLVAAITTGLTAGKAALANPARTLRES